MTDHAREQQLRTLLSEKSKKNVSSTGLDEDLAQVLGLDSLAGLRMLATVEKHFGVRFPDQKLAGLRTLRSLLEALAAAAAENSP